MINPTLRLLIVGALLAVVAVLYFALAGFFRRRRPKRGVRRVPRAAALVFVSGALTLAQVADVTDGALPVAIAAGALLWLIGGIWLSGTDDPRLLASLALAVGLVAQGLTLSIAHYASREAAAELQRLEQDPHTRWCREGAKGSQMTEASLGCLGSGLVAWAHVSRVQSFPWIAGTSALAVAALIGARLLARN